MIEDKLDTEQRIRLEALNQAVHTTQMGAPTGNLIRKAEVFEKYIKEGTGG